LFTCNAVGAALRAGLDLAGVGADREIGVVTSSVSPSDARSPRYRRALRHLDRGQRSLSEPIWFTFTRIELAMPSRMRG